MFNLQNFLGIKLPYSETVKANILKTKSTSYAIVHYSCSLSTTTKEYSYLSVCVCLFVSVAVCLLLWEVPFGPKLLIFPSFWA